MVLCKYFMDGKDCPTLQKCPDEHLDIRQFIKTEMECAINGDQWPLSCFGPFTEKPCISNYIEDQSFEEVRMMYYGGSNQSFFESCQQFSKAINDAKTKMRTLLTMNTEVMDVLADLYDEPPKEITQAKGNPFDFFANGAFGGLSSGVFQFGSTTSPGSGFFGGSQKSVLGQNTFGFGFGVQTPQTGGFFKPPQLAQSGGIFATQQPLPQQVQQVNTVPEVAPTPKGCDDCKQYYKEIVALMGSILNAVNENKAVLQKQDEEIKSLSESLKNATLNGKETATETTKMEETCAKICPRNVPPLVITPKRKQNSTKTKTEIKDSIDPLGLSIQINSMSKSANGSIIIKCRNEESIRKLESEIKAKLDDMYDTKVVKLVSPRILVNGIDNDLDEDTLIETIKKQNDIKGDMKLIRCFEKINNGYKYNAIIEVDKALYKTLMDTNEPYFNIGWNKCNVFDNLNVKRCFNCWGFSHNARNCRSETKCPKCGGEHSETHCKSRKLKCMNCTMANVRLNLNLDIGHDSRNHNCHVYLKMLQKERDMIDY